jgi:hypothetical protein
VLGGNSRGCCCAGWGGESWFLGRGGRAPWQEGGELGLRLQRGARLAIAVREREDGVGGGRELVVSCINRERVLDMPANIEHMADTIVSTLGGRFWLFLFGIGSWSVYEIFSLIYTLQILYRT